MEDVQRVLIIGAGVAGLQAARALLKAGYKVVVIEEQEDVGGCWLRNYAGHHLNGELILSMCTAILELACDRARHPPGPRSFAQSSCVQAGVPVCVAFECVMLENDQTTTLLCIYLSAPRSTLAAVSVP